MRGPSSLLIGEWRATTACSWSRRFMTPCRPIFKVENLAVILSNSIIAPTMPAKEPSDWFIRRTKTICHFPLVRLTIGLLTTSPASAWLRRRMKNSRSATLMMVSGDTIINVADREFFIRLRDHADAGLVVSKPIVSRTNGKWQIVLVRRMNQSDGSFAGIVSAVIELDKITAKFSTLNICRHGVINLRDHEQAVVARYSPIKSDDGPLIGQKIISRQLEEQLRIAPEAGIYRAISPLDHLERAFSYRKLPSYPFYIFVGLSTDDYLGEWWREVA